MLHLLKHYRGGNCYLKYGQYRFSIVGKYSKRHSQSDNGNVYPGRSKILMKKNNYIHMNYSKFKEIGGILGKIFAPPIICESPYIRQSNV